LYLHSRITLKL